MATGPAAPAHDHDAHGYGHDEHGHYPSFFTRWFCSTNHKDIGTLYIIFAIIAGLIGGLFSVLMRAQLMHPAGTVIEDHQLYNVIATAHCLIMIFFMVMPAMIGGFGHWVVAPMVGAPPPALPPPHNNSLWLAVPAFSLLLRSP